MKRGPTQARNASQQPWSMARTLPSGLNATQPAAGISNRPPNLFR